MQAEELLFFEGVSDCLPIYGKLRESVVAIDPAIRVIVSKTQIAFAVKRRFAFVSLRGRKMIVTFGLPVRLEAARIRQATEPYPNRWTHHVWVNGVEEIDAELLGWIEQAYLFASRK